MRACAGADDSFELYEDDGTSFAHKKGDWMRVAMTWTDAARQFRVRLAPGSRLRPPLTRSIEVRVAGSTTSRRVTFTGSPVAVTLR